MYDAAFTDIGQHFPIIRQFILGCTNAAVPNLENTVAKTRIKIDMSFHKQQTYFIRIIWYVFNYYC